MRRKLISLALILVVVCSFAVPAAAQSADARLSAVTAQVKSTLDLDTTCYTEFLGNLHEELLAPIWELEWSGSIGTLSVSATEEGKILRYYVHENQEETHAGIFAPSFPAGDRASARNAAMGFIQKVLAGNESIMIEDSGSDSLNALTYRFRGEILINGLSAGLTYSIAVRCADNKVIAFSRDDLNGAVMGGIPPATPKILSDQAGAVLRKTLALRLEYVLAQENGPTAVLRYVPKYGDDYYVDAASGTLVNLTELARDISKGSASPSGGAEAAADSAAAPDAGLTSVEQSSAAKLEGVLDREALDAKARAITELGLSSYALSTANYTVPKGADEAETVTATLRYGQQVGGISWRRMITMNAKTGELLQVTSSAWMPGDAKPAPAVTRSVDVITAGKTANAFLTKLCSVPFSQTELYNSTDALEQTLRVSHSFTFAQKVNGYFFPENSIRVGVDSTDGSISYYEKQFDDSVTFDTPVGIISEEQALDAWLSTYTVDLQYVPVPTAVDHSKPEYAPLRDYGIDYLYKLVLGYSLERKGSFAGLDAKTGTPIVYNWAGRDECITYNDLVGHWAKEKIETLAQFGIGYIGGTFDPDRELTQLDLVALLTSTEGYLYDPSQEGAAEQLYEAAYRMGLLRRAERQDDAVLSRIATVRMILDAMGYGPVAQLDNIFCTSFTDQRSIPPEDLGYAALAQGLGMVSGDSTGQFLPHSNATRAQAAVMIYNLMAR